MCATEREAKMSIDEMVDRWMFVLSEIDYDTDIDANTK